MAKATVVFSPNRNAASITFDRERAYDLPVDAINYALEKIYAEPDGFGPYLYEAYNADDQFIGLVVSEPFGATCREDIYNEYRFIIESHDLVAVDLDPKWATKEITV
jgi:hypothetical protein